MCDPPGSHTDHAVVSSDMFSLETTRSQLLWASAPLWWVELRFWFEIDSSKFWTWPLLQNFWCLCLWLPHRWTWSQVRSADRLNPSNICRVTRNKVFLLCDLTPGSSVTGCFHLWPGVVSIYSRCLNFTVLLYSDYTYIYFHSYSHHLARSIVQDHSNPCVSHRRLQRLQNLIDEYQAR